MGDSPRSANASPAHSDASGVGRKSIAQSRNSGKVTFPNSAQSRGSAITYLSDDEPDKNPFRMPPENDIFMLRDKEREKKKQERIKQRKLKVHEKTTYASRVNFKTASTIHPANSDDDEGQEEDDDKAVAVKDDPQFTIAVTRDRHVEKESLADYITKKREMFLVQYSLGVKRDEMRKLEDIAGAEEKKLELAEQYLEEDAAMFDEFLKENDKNSVEAIKIAEAETKAKLEKVAEIKKINAQMMGIKSEISKYEDTLKEYQLYKRFLDALTPKEYSDKRDAERQKRREERRKARQASTKPATPGMDEKSGTSLSVSNAKTNKGRISRQSSKTPTGKKGDKDNSSVVVVAEDMETSEESEEELDLYFTDPQQLLDIFAELEEQNLSLIQNSQEVEEALEEMKQTMKQTKHKMEKETEVLKDQIDKLNDQINKEEEKAAELEMKARMFSYGEFKAEDQEKMLAQLNSKVEEVYNSCIGNNEANIGTLQMLTNIENRLEELFEMIEMMPPDKVEAAEKSKEKERRLKLREEKMEQQRIHQEERVKRALERAKADPKKKTGRRLVGRSEPPRLKKKEDDGADQASREEEELAYFFT